MSNVVELRNLVRTQTQTDPGDLPDSTIDAYLQQGFERTINGETRWPFYAQTWDLVQTPGETTLVLAGDVNVPGIVTLADKASGVRLGMVPQQYAEDCYGGRQSGGYPAMYSIWGNQVFLWPTVSYSEPHTYSLRGYRRPLTWLTPEMSPDCDQRFHMALIHFACSLAYAQQEDEVLEASYMQRWQTDVELARRAIMDPVYHRPLIGGGSIEGQLYPGAGWVIVPPSTDGGGGSTTFDEVWVGPGEPGGGGFELWVDTDEAAATADEVWVGPTDPGPGSGFELWVNTEADPPTADEVWVGPTEPAAGIEIWVDTDED